MLKAILFLLLTLFSSCANRGLGEEEAIQKYSKIAYKSERLVLEGYKLGKEEDFAILFKSEKQINLDEARRLMLASVFKFMAVLQSHCSYPYSEEDVTFGIQFKDEQGEFFKEGYIAEVSMVYEDIIYYVWDEKTQERKKIHKEMFSDAFGKSFGYPIELSPYFHLRD